jgi:hypothetical protein
MHIRLILNFVVGFVLAQETKLEEWKDDKENQIAWNIVKSILDKKKYVRAALPVVDKNKKAELDLSWINSGDDTVTLA